MDKWVKAADRLPENDDTVLVLCAGVDNNVEMIDALQFGYYWEPEGWILEDWPEVRELKVSWWRPLPELPGEVTEV